MKSNVETHIPRAADLRGLAAVNREAFLLQDYQRMVVRMVMHMNDAAEYHATAITLQLFEDGYQIMFNDGHDRVVTWSYDNAKTVVVNEAERLTCMLHTNFVQQGYDISNVTSYQNLSALNISWAGDVDVVKSNATLSWVKQLFWWCKWD